MQDDNDKTMSIFAKPITNISTGDLDELLVDRPVENIRLEFKREMPDKDEVLKKLSSFANTFGGLLIIGADANGKDGRLVGLPGVEAQRSYRQTIVQWCTAGASPPLTVEVSDPIPISEGNGRVCYVINTPESDLGPHFLNGRRGVYTRTDEFSNRVEVGLATEHELRQLLNRRQLVRDRRTRLFQRARERYKTFAAMPSTPVMTDREFLDSRVELGLCPRFPASQLCEHHGLLTTLREQSEMWRHSAFPSNRNTAMTQHESAIILQPCGHGSYLEATIWGTLFYTTPIAERNSRYTGIHTPGFIGHVLVFLRHAMNLLTKMGYSGPVHTELALHDIRDIPWIVFRNDFPTKASTCPLDNTVTLTLETTTTDLQHEPNAFACELLRLVFFAMGWPDIADSREKLKAIIADGYNFNVWPSHLAR